MDSAVNGTTPRVVIRPSAPASFVSWFVLGLAIGMLMVVNSQLSSDQAQLLNLGWQLAHNHVWVPHGMITSAGGFSPGGFSGLLVALPLYLWNDYRAPALFTLILHAGAFVLLVRALKPALSDFGRYLLLVLVWLSPWHLYFAAHVWDANYMYVFAVLHLITAQRMAQRREIRTTAAHVLLLGLSVQVHTSGAVLCILSVLLFASGRLKVSWQGFALGVAACVASLAPWLWAVHQDASLLPGGKGFLLRGLAYGFPLFRGVLYWVKLSSLSFVARMYDLDFTAALGPTAGPVFGTLAQGLATVATATLLVTLWLQWRFFRHAPRRFLAQVCAPYRPRSWLRFYVIAMCAAALISFALSPTTIMFWQVFVALPASALAVVMSAEALARSRLRLPTHRVAGAWAAMSAALVLSQAIASPMYRCGGYTLTPSTPMLVGLRARDKCLRAAAPAQTPASHPTTALTPTRGPKA
ncbi:MAG TPA: hypothetical protein VMC02_06380 [Steroidobacteraceae bacterium]|nr:hypothetical protein [Steroidobacteraceae bacterium]